MSNAREGGNTVEGENDVDEIVEEEYSVGHKSRLESRTEGQGESRGFMQTQKYMNLSRQSEFDCEEI